jgi:hypothetical protein
LQGSPKDGSSVTEPHVIGTADERTIPSMFIGEALAADYRPIRPSRRTRPAAGGGDAALAVRAEVMP